MSTLSNGTHDPGSRASAKEDNVNSAPHGMTPIAIVGMACRFPGDAVNVKGLWDMCCEGRSAWSEIPQSRMNAEAFFHPDPAKTGSFNSRGAHFIKEDVGLFDAPFFNISPYEAKAMDPQQRILLETTYEALENSGTTLDKLRGQNVGVYVGAAAVDYGDFFIKDPETNSTYLTTGTATNILSNRLSYFFDLRGPSITVDTACSSSLAAFHLACQSLRTGETRQAIVGGAHLILSPDTMIAMSNLRLHGEEGRSFTYDHRGTGYGRGEGVATLVLKPLQDAIDAGDTVRAIIRATGMNQDGKTNGITLPSKDAQEDLIRSTYEASGLDPLETLYVEAHGTGTKVGDPVEAEAISCAMATGRTSPLIVGSVKTNIGHLEAASGLAGVIKTACVLETGLIPPNLNFEKPNENIPLQQWNLKVPTELTSWPSAGVRRASISSFGFGGTNIHVIMEQFRNVVKFAEVNGASPTLTEPNSPISTNGNDNYDVSGLRKEPWVLLPNTNSGHRRRRLFLLAASDEESVKKQSQDLSQYLRTKTNQQESFLSDLAFTLANRRFMLEWRLVASSSSIEELQATLENRDVHLNRVSKTPGLGFVFTGQGAQWPTMGQQLMIYPVFTSALRDADECLRCLGAEWSLLDELARPKAKSSIHDAHISQPATTAIQIGIVMLLRSWNIKPSAVVGHSSGEIAAAFSAGILDLDSCMRIAYHRGALTLKLKQEFPSLAGGMLAIGASVSDAQQLVDRIQGAKVVIACMNGPSLVTASGDREGIEQLQQLAEKEGIFARTLRVDVAYHSYHMENVAGFYRESLGDLPSKPSRGTTFYSSLHGRRADSEALDTAYWVANLTKPVRFTEALHDLCVREGDAKIDTLVEIGPHSALQAPIQDLLKSNPDWGTKFRYLSCLKRDEDACSNILSAVGHLVARGYPVDISRVNLDESKKVLVDLPSYPWMHKRRHWYESRLSLNHRFKKFPRNDLLGFLVEDMNGLEPRWRSKILLSEVPWLRDHRVQSTIAFPFAGYISMALQAAYQQAVSAGQTVTDSTKYEFREVTVQRSLVLTETSETELSVIFKRQREGSRGGLGKWNEFTIYSWTESTGWSEHCRGLITVSDAEGEPNVIDGVAALEARTSQIEDFIEEKKNLCTTPVDCTLYYEKISDLGLQFGPNFQGLRAGSVGPSQCIGKVQVLDTAASMPRNFESDFVIHPTVLDACLQSASLALTGADLAFSTLYIPTYVESMSVTHAVHRIPGQELTAYTTARLSESGKELEAKYLITNGGNQETQPMIEINGFINSAVPTSVYGSGADDKRGLCFTTQTAICVGLLTTSQYGKVFYPGRVLEACEQTRMVERAAFYLARIALPQLSSHDIQALGGHLRKLYNFLTARVAQVFEDDGVPFQRPEWLEAGDVDVANFLTAVESSSAFGKLVCEVGKNLPVIFRGEVEPLSIMLKDGLLEQFYQTCITLDHLYTKGGLFIKELGYQNPQLRVLEIGAGTGSATVHVLNALSSKERVVPRFASFDYTDITAGFFERAKERFERWSGFMNFRRLDIEHSPIEQGFEPNSYDLIVASEVLHAVASMDSTMRNVRALLKPGGKLVVIESILPTTFGSIVFGTLPGWWAGEEPERVDGPTLRVDQWDVLLRQTGFSGIDGSLSHTLDESLDPPTGATMISTAISVDSKQYPNVSLVLAKPSPRFNIESLTESLMDVTGNSPDLQHFDEISISDSDGKIWIVLALEDFSLLHLSEHNFVALQNVLLRSQGVLWVTRGARGRSPEAAMIDGLARVIRSENTAVKFAVLDLDDDPILSDTEAAGVIAHVYGQVFGGADDATVDDQEYIEDKGVIKIRRVVEHESKDRYIMRETQQPVPEPQPFVQEGRPLRLKLGTPGLLDSIYFEDDLSLKPPVADEEVEMDIKATGMNFKDVMIGLGQIPFSHIGVECSGVVTAVGRKVQGLIVGDRICALTPEGYRNRIRVHWSVTGKIPDDMSFTAAASIPVVFCTAYYALVDVARLSQGESVLIHAAAGGVGQAAIMIAQRIDGVEVYATVGSVEKKTLIMENYGIPEDHIFSSRDTTFVQRLRDMTKGRGVDVILNSLAGAALSLSWRKCLAPLGRFIEIGKRDLAMNNNLEMRKFLQSVTFAGVDLEVLISSKPKAIHELLKKVIKEHKEGAWVPVWPRTIFKMSELQHAMRLMQSGKHMGKMVITPGSRDIVQVMPTKDHKPVARSDATYLITGGTGGLGRSITRWLASQGARNIVLASRSGMNQFSTRELVDDLKSQGVEVLVYACDISVEEQVKKMINYVQETMPPIRGVIHGAMILKDALFETASFDDWNTVVRVRVQGAWNLHHVLLGTELDFFVMLSSAAGITGNRGQASYAASNTFMDAFAGYRSQRGLPASTIDIGVVGDVGYVAEHAPREAQIRASFHDVLNEKEVLALVRAAINYDLKDSGSWQTITGVKLLPDQAFPYWAADPRFSHVVRSTQSTTGDVATKSKTVSLRDSLKQVTTLAEVQQIVEEALAGKIANLSMTPREDIDAQKPLAAYGMDSLVAVEIRNWITNEMAASINALEFIASSSLAGLTTAVIGKSTLIDLGALSASTVG